LVTQNLLYDISQTAIPFDNVDKDFLEKPRKWDTTGISRFMLSIGPISSIFDFVTFGAMWYFFKANSLSSAPLFQSGWFVEALLSQLLIVHLIRTRQIPFLQSRASAPLMFGTIAIVAICIYAPYSTLGNQIGLVPLPSSYFILLTIILLSYGVLMYAVKVRFIKRFGDWL
jgi:Mg2+-importing ATPase